MPTIVEDIINNCKELRCVRFTLCSSSSNDQASLKSVHNHNLQQLYIDSPFIDVPDDFMASISSHGGLVHVVMCVRYFTTEGVTSLLRNSPELLTFFLIVCLWDEKLDVLDIKLKKLFSKRQLFTGGDYIVVFNQYTMLDQEYTLWRQIGTHLF